MLRLSHAHLCSEHFAECDFVNFMTEQLPSLFKKSNTNAYGRKGRERKRLYTNACGKERKNRPKNACGKERKTKPQMLVANEKWLP